jgi:hypothetical protein
MRTNLKTGLSCVLALGLAACGSNTTDNGDAAVYVPPADAYVAPTADAAVTPTPDAAVVPDTTPVTADPYIWVVIQDTEQVACTTNGPGADIDAVELVSGTGTPLGWGRTGWAKFTPNPRGDACANADCSGGNCKYAAISTTFTEADLVARTTGVQDGQVNAATSDVGYFSLNGGTLQIQIGDLTGAGLAQELMQGDQIKVYEVDKTYISDGYAPANCSCLPEHYTVSIQTAKGATLPLKPTLLAAENTTCAALTTASTDGCGTTLFVVP